MTKKRVLHCRRALLSYDFPFGLNVLDGFHVDGDVGLGTKALAQALLNGSGAVVSSSE